MIGVAVAICRSPSEGKRGLTADYPTLKVPRRL